MTLKNDAVNVYLDEDPLAIITGITPKTTDNSIVRFGINNTKPAFQGQLFDWIAWDATGAYAPGEGTALPSELTGLPGGGPSSVSDIRTTENLSAYPNPFTSGTTIAYKVETTSMTRIDVYDVTGKLVKNLFNDIQVPGTHELKFSGENMPAGMYYCHARSGNSVSVVKMLLR